MTISRPDPATAPRLRGLDGLRFFAAFAVLLYHFAAFDSYSAEIWGEPVGDVIGPVGVWFGYGSLAPYLFFTVSGFVILMSAQGRDLRRFVASRIGRLYPAYWVAVLATAALLLLVWNPGRSITWDQVLVNLTMFQPAFDYGHVDGVYWTLWVEMKFYILMLVFILVGITARRVMLVAALWPVLAWALVLAQVPQADQWLIYRQAPFFAGGMVLYLIHRDGHSVLRWLVLGANMVLAVVHTAPRLFDQVDERTPYELEPAVIGAGVLVCFVLVAVLSLTRWQHLQWRWLTALGSLTYPLYLLHQYWGWWVISMVSDYAPAALSVAAGAAVSLLLAWALHRWVTHV